ncbi:MAG: T9SS type A sorting domain-containing protein [Bacteroidetes bacterium]|nr:T9SS type A sorting domain-containing protein [Bacteroidota bacterium]
MKTLRQTFLLLCVCCSVQTFSQNENTKWYFGGHAALDFMTNPPTILNNSAMNVLEGCSSIADATGNLLFYTDGVTVWNQQHIIMANGTGLLGGGTAAQSSFIVKRPGSANLYYIFTVQGAGGTAGLNYSVVDMNLAAGMGSVTVLNSPLYSGQCAEKIAVTKHSNGTDYWIMTHDYDWNGGFIWNCNHFNAYLLTSAGVNTTAVVSTIGQMYSSFFSCMKFSPTGQKLGAVVDLGSIGGIAELYDFDNSTGVVSNSLTLINSLTSTSAFPSVYGCEFSPDGTKFYSSGSYGTIIQWDLSTGSNPAILASAAILGYGVFRSMQLAPNGKIYIAAINSQSISIINNPNIAGSGCNLVYLGQAVSALNINNNSNSVSQYGLPNILTQPCFIDFTIQGNNTICQGNLANAAINVLGNSGSVNYFWTNGTITHTTSQASLTTGSWSISIKDSTGCMTNSVFAVSQYPTFTANISSSGLNVCVGNSVVLTASGANTYTWSTGSQVQSIVVSPTVPTQYSVSATDQYGCVLSSTVFINAMATPEISLNTSNGNYFACVGDTLVLSVNGANAYAWSANGNVIANTQTLAVAPTNNTTYYVTGIAPNGCESLSIPVSVTVAPKPALSIRGSTIYCSAQIVTLTASGAYNYYWQWGGAHAHASSPNIVLKQGVTTQYTLTGTSEYGCKSVEMITVVIGCVGVDGLKDESLELRVYPNPSNGEIFVEGNFEQGTKVLITNVLGQQVVISDLSNTKNSVCLKAKGIYFYKILSSNKQTATGKIIVE